MTLAREIGIQRRIQIDLCRDARVRLWRNNVGLAWQGHDTLLPNGDVLLRNPRRVRYGLAPGSSDLIGLIARTITPAMVGMRLAQFIALEIKTSSGKPSKDQRAWLAMASALGGVAGVARSSADALALVSPANHL